MKKLTCALLLSDHARLADAAETFARAAFDVRYTVRRSRWDNTIDTTMEKGFDGGFDCLLNLLCPVILPKRLLDLVRGPAINFHPGPPEWPGVGAPSLALYHEEAAFGVTAHYMTGKVDAGPIINVIRFPIVEGDTCESLFSRALDHVLVMFDRVATEVSRGKTPEACGETWKRAAMSRNAFERWMTLRPDVAEDELRRKVKALRHSKYPGPFVEIGGLRFELPPSSQHCAKQE